ncbi:hypothetical protein PRIPAC_74052 [Pristionchus pacificus]|uniref:acyl-CoA oxidase n=1 Tax=Pristionchus pacificus TaxID=54126 RepID=A0A2A6BFP7_PRIPA|nr:hypothetical protein PRIPAC_74052 [Pristionchus pacificus]|eukprot:PDM64678.1 hypothetical protein PRIPAC_52934 [Pristionchus pacificus]
MEPTKEVSSEVDPYENMIQAGDNPDITKERKSASFNLYKMQCFVYEGQYKLKRRQEILDFVESHKEFDDPVHPHFLNREEQIDRATRKCVAMMNNLEAIDVTDYFDEAPLYQFLTIGRELHCLSLHYGMFLPTIQNQCDEEQLEEWLGPAASKAILGTFAQTELGHGSNLSKLETTATYDAKTQEFVIHTPQMSAAKWWPGGLGKSANYAAVMAQLHTNGENKGPHLFMVPLRDTTTHLPLPGITVGDIGPKFGINANDNGFLIFDNYRIPRRNMLMKYSKVEPDGTYIAPPHSKLGFGTMVLVRSLMIRDQASQLGSAAVIAIRYSAVRRQGEINEGEGEVQILDYRTQQYRLLPQLARSFAFLFAGYEIRATYLHVTKLIRHSANTELLPELHALSSGLKAVITWEVAQGIEQLRLSCGGHGYSRASAFPDIYTYAVGGCTYEGENIVMLLQVARFLMKIAKEVRTGTPKLAEIAEYIARTDSGAARVSRWKTCADEDIIHDFEAVTRKMIFSAFDRLKSLEGTMKKKEAWNACSIDLCKVARMHVKTYLVKNFLARVRTCEDSASKTVMHTLAKLYAFDLISGAGGHFMKGGFLSETQANQVQVDIYEMLNSLRPEAVALADSWAISDLELRSVLGRRDGNVYPALLEWAKASPLNKSEVLPTFDKYLDPMFKEGRSHLMEQAMVHEQQPASEPSPYANLIQHGDNPDITKERRTASFNLHKMQCFVYENAYKVKRRQEIHDYVKSNKDFEDPVHPYYLDRADYVDRATKQIVAMMRHTDAFDVTDYFDEGPLFQFLTVGKELHCFSLHYGMFLPTIQNQSDEEQLEEWLAPAMNRAILGTFAQTEMGHGSNLSKLETIATYDAKTQEFVIHTPTMSAAKWWPGGLGKSVNHAAVMAQLHTNGENKGPHLFFVPLRDTTTHMPFPGVKVGDIGPKFGINANDNGFLVFDNYRIPRRNMFMKFSKVEPDGTYVAPPHAKLGFGAMVLVRSLMIRDQASQLGCAAVIAIRYSSVRRQGEINEGEGEVQILDYRTQQYRLLPQLARSFAFLFAAYEVKAMYFKVTAQIQKSANTELLPELHALSSGLKAVITWEVAQGIEQLRLSCGGHGYSRASAFPDIYTYAVGGCTYEGENIVMLLQVARFLMKIAHEVRTGTPKLAEIAEYIGRKDSGRARVRSWKTCSDEEIVHDFEAVARKLIFSSYDRLHSLRGQMNKKEAWNACSIDLCKAARVMHTLAKLYAFDLISGAGGHFMKGGFLSEQQSDQIQADIYEMLKTLRPEAVALADSWAISDLELRSVLGRRDGNVYPAMLEWAKNSPLNKTEVLPTFEKYLEPMMKEGRSHLGISSEGTPHVVQCTASPLASACPLRVYAQARQTA